MILVDSSVWIAHLRNENISQVNKLRTMVEPDDILVGDLIIVEVLQGARDDRHAASIERKLRQFEIAPLLNPVSAPTVARNYRRLRDRGVTVRKTIDVVIGTFCIVNGHRLLHADRDFDPMVAHLGLMPA